MLTYFASHGRCRARSTAQYAIEETKRWWQEWADLANFEPHKWRDAVVRSLITLKALTYAPTGGIIAAPTTSLPEALGGERNWDYRYCWLRDATLTLVGAHGGRLPRGGRGVARLAAARRSPATRRSSRSCTEPAGERNLEERECRWLPGYEGSKPVRIGNAAAGQYQLDVYGEVSAPCTSHGALGVEPAGPAWDLELALMDFLETGWKEPDDGIWEVRGPRRHFTHSKVMAWVAMDRAVTTSRTSGCEGPVGQVAGRCATRSTKRCSRRATTPNATPSPSTTARRSSTRAC